MVIRFIFISLLLSSFLFSGEFTATANRNELRVGESFTLNLTLKDASAQGSPALEDLKKLFVIHSQHQSSNTIMRNGYVSSSISWKMTLMPQKEGEFFIPSISIQTTEGMLSTNPVKIKVVQGDSSSHESSSDLQGVTISVEVNKKNPYKSEPISYTVKLASKIDLANVKIQQFNIEEAIVEPNGEPKVSRKMIDGVRVDAVEFNYWVTPLKAGPLKIPSIAIQGEFPVRRQSQGSFFDEFGPFFIMPGFDQLQPFMLMTQEDVLDVQPAIPEVNPWLPAKSIKIEERWDDSQLLQVGEPLIRSFKISAEGVMASQLPSLEDLQTSNDLFKVYADKPEMSNESKEGNIHSLRKEQYTLIPQQSGTLTLPEISLTWWNVEKKEKIIARIPSRTLNILPPVEQTKNTILPPIDSSSSNSTGQDPMIHRDPLMYVFMGGLTILLLGTLLWAISLQKKIVRLTEAPMTAKTTATKTNDKNQKMGSTEMYKPLKPEMHKPGKDKNEKLPDLNPT